MHKTPKYSPLLQQLHIQANGTHEKVDAAKSFGCHSRGQRLGKRHSIKHAILDSKDQPPLLIVGCVDTHGSKELPNVDILASINASRENVRQRRLESGEEYFKGSIP